MVEREQGPRAERADVSINDVRGGHDDTVAVSALPETERVEHARRAQFLAALDKIMADHHEVLAALAK